MLEFFAGHEEIIANLEQFERKTSLPVYNDARLHIPRLFNDTDLYLYTRQKTPPITHYEVYQIDDLHLMT